MQSHARPIPADAAERVINVWKKMLADAREPKQRRIGVDGETYRFDLLQPQLNSAGIWSPDENSRTAGNGKARYRSRRIRQRSGESRKTRERSQTARIAAR